MKISASFRIQEEIRWHMRKIEAFQLAAATHQVAIEDLQFQLAEAEAEEARQGIDEDSEQRGY